MSKQNIKKNVEIQNKIDYEKKFRDLKIDKIGIQKDALLNILIGYNNKALDRADEYVNQKRITLEINLTIVLITLAIVTVILDTLNYIEILILIVILAIYFVLLLANLIYNLLEQKTKFKEKKEESYDFWTTPRFFRGNIQEYKNENIPMLKKDLYNFAKYFGLKEKSNDQNKSDLEDKLIKDEIKNLFQLFWFQAHYFKMTNITRNFSLIGTVFIFVSMILLISFNPFFP